jgi:anti-sigma B factor antagonist
MNMIITYKDDTAFIKINTERFDHQNAKEAKDTLFEIIDNGTHKIVLNLSSMEFMDSTGLTVLVSIFKQINSVNGELKLCPLNKQPIELLKIIQLDKLLTFLDSDECIATNKF